MTKHRFHWKYHQRRYIMCAMPWSLDLKFDTSVDPSFFFSLCKYCLWEKIYSGHMTSGPIAYD